MKAIIDMTYSSIEKELFSKGEVVYTNRGDSMYPLIRSNGDIIIVKRKTFGFKKYDVPLYKRDNGKYVLHRILKVNKDGTYVTCGDNRYTKEYGLTDDNMLGILTAVVRNGKEIRLNSLGCSIYAHLWCDLFAIRMLILVVAKVFKKIKGL